jgi:hypothetical protein
MPYPKPKKWENPQPKLRMYKSRSPQKTVYYDVGWIKDFKMSTDKALKDAFKDTDTKGGDALRGHGKWTEKKTEPPPLPELPRDPIEFKKQMEAIEKMLKAAGEEAGKKGKKGKKEEEDKWTPFPMPKKDWGEDDEEDKPKEKKDEEKTNPELVAEVKKLRAIVAELIIQYGDCDGEYASATIADMLIEKSVEELEFEKDYARDAHSTIVKVRPKGNRAV